MKLTDRDWSSFSYSDIFSEIKRGARQVASSREPGNIPYYSASKTNNGLTDFIQNPVFIEESNAVVYSTFGDAYYVEREFSTSDEMTILKSSKINRFSGIFLANCLKMNKEKYSFGRKAFTGKILKDKIMLPTTFNGTPDWDFMEAYIREREEEKIEKYKAYAASVLDGLEYKEVERLEEKEWGSFLLKEIFTEINKGKRLVKEKRINGPIPLLTAGESNQGVAEFINNSDMPAFKDFVSIDMFGTALYHDYEASGDDNIHFFINDSLSKESKLFTVRMINKNKNKYSYGKQFRLGNAYRESVILPITQQGCPDWEYMEQYMKNLMIQKYKKYSNARI